MIRIIVASVLLAFLGSGAVAQSSLEVLAVCKGKPDNERLACFDRLSRVIEEVEEATKTKDVLASKPVEYRATDISDLYVAPRKYIGKGVELKGAQCFHADANEYRCVTLNFVPVMIISPDISPSDAKSKLEDECGEIKKVHTPICRRTIKFVAKSYDEDTISGNQKRVVIITDKLEMTENSGRKKRR